MLEHFFSNAAGGGDSQIVHGMVGWEDEKEYYFLGSDENDGHTLVRVQLFEGRDHTKPLNPARAQGHKIVCHLSGGLFRIPKPGTRVFVAIPKGMEQVPGAGVIFATIEKSPTSQFADDRAVLDFGEDHHVVIRGKSVSLQDPDNRFLTVGTPRSGGRAGLTFQAADGTGGVIQEGVVGWFVAEGGDAKTLIQMTPDRLELMRKGGTGTTALKLSGDFTLVGPGNGYIMPATLVLGAVGAGTPPYALAGTLGKVSGCVFISSDT